MDFLRFLQEPERIRAGKDFRKQVNINRYSTRMQL